MTDEPKRQVPYYSVGHPHCDRLNTVAFVLRCIPIRKGKKVYPKTGIMWSDKRIEQIVKRVALKTV